MCHSRSDGGDRYGRARRAASRNFESIASLVHGNRPAASERECRYSLVAAASCRRPRSSQQAKVLWALPLSSWHSGYLRDIFEQFLNAMDLDVEGCLAMKEAYEGFFGKAEKHLANVGDGLPTDIDS